MFSSLAVSNCASFFRKTETTLPKWQLIMWLGRMVWSLVFFFFDKVFFSLFWGWLYDVVEIIVFFLNAFFRRRNFRYCTRFSGKIFIFFRFSFNNKQWWLSSTLAFIYIHSYICSFPNLLKDYDKIKMFVCKWE